MAKIWRTIVFSGTSPSRPAQVAATAAWRGELGMRARHLALSLPVLSAAVLDEPTADVRWQRLQDRTVQDLLPPRPVRPCEVDGDATLIEVAAVMAQTGLPLLAVRGAGRLLGGITSSRLLARLLTRP